MPKEEKFRIGQVVAIKSERHRCGPKYFRIAIRNIHLGVIFYGDGENPQYAQHLLRALTKKEMAS